MLIHLVTDHSDHFSHGKCGEDRTDSKPIQMSEDNQGHQSCYHKAGNVVANLDSGIFYLRDICQFSREQVCRDDRQTAAIGKCDSDAQKQVADDKVNYPVTNGCRQDVNPHFMYIEHLAECKSDNEAKKIRCYEFLSHDHQRQYQKSLENVSPGSKGNLIEHFRKCIWYTGNR